MPSVYQEQGLTGLSYYGGYVTEEFLPALSGRKALEVFTQMKDNDPVCGAILFAIDMMCRQVKWWVEPASQESDDVEVSDFVESCRTDMSMTWEDTISEIFSMLPYGWAYHEIVYKRRDGEHPDDGTLDSRYNDRKIGWRKFPIRSQDSLDHWEFDSGGGIKSMVQKPPPDYQDREISIQKALLFRTSTYKNNPEGRSIFRNGYRPWYFKKRIEEIEGIGVERDLAGIPMAEVDPEILKSTASNLDVEIRNHIKSIVTSIRRDTNEGILWPMMYDKNNNQMYKLSLLTSGGSRQFDTSAIINRWDQRLSTTVLADFILLGQNAVGSYALSSDKTNLFSVALGTWLDVIAGVFNRFAIPRLLKLNNIEVEEPPKLVHGDIETPDLDVIANFVTSLAGAGATIFPDARLENKMRSMAGLPELSEEQEEAIGNNAAVDIRQNRGLPTSDEPEEEYEE